MAKIFLESISTLLNHNILSGIQYTMQLHSYQHLTSQLATYLCYILSYILLYFQQCIYNYSFIHYISICILCEYHFLYVALFLLLPYIFGSDNLLCSHPNLIVSTTEATAFCQIQGLSASSYNVCTTIKLYCTFRTCATEWSSNLLWFLAVSSLSFTSQPHVPI